MEKALIIYCGGTWDLIHVGHVDFFRRIKEWFPNCKLVAALNTDEFIKEYKGFYPLYSYADRKRFLESIEYIDEVIPNEGGKDSTVSILKVKPDIIAIGTDWLQRDYCAQMNFTSKWLDENHISLIFISLIEGISGTEIKRRVKA